MEDLTPYGEVVTFEMAKAELEAIEKKLAEQHGLTENVRETLVDMDRRGDLVEDELVTDWHDALSVYLEWAGVTTSPWLTT